MENINEEHSSSEKIFIFKDIEVYCAWCKKFLYKVEAYRNKKYSTSHGICEECADRVFNIKEKVE